MSQSKSKGKVKDSVYDHLLMSETRPTPETVDWVHTKTGALKASIHGVLSTLLTGRGKETLQRLGYAPQGLPSWVGSEDPALKPPLDPSDIPQGIVMRAPPSRDTFTPPSPSPDLPPPTSTLLPPQGAFQKRVAYREEGADNPNDEQGRVGEGEDRMKVGEDEVEEETLESVYKGSPMPLYVRIEGGGMAEVTKLPDGRTVLIPIDKEPTKASEPGTGGKISDLIFKNVEVSTQTILRKVALNPSVFQSYAWVKSKTLNGERIFPERYDVGDFLNYCVDFTMFYGFGARPGMIVGGPALLTKMAQGQGQGQQLGGVYGT